MWSRDQSSVSRTLESTFWRSLSWCRNKGLAWLETKNKTKTNTWFKRKIVENIAYRNRPIYFAIFESKLCTAWLHAQRSWYTAWIPAICDLTLTAVYADKIASVGLMSTMIHVQGVALTGRNRTVPPCSVGRRTGHAPARRRPTAHARYRWQTTPTDDSVQNNTDPLGGPVIKWTEIDAGMHCWCISLSSLLVMKMSLRFALDMKWIYIIGVNPS